LRSTCRTVTQLHACPPLFPYTTLFRSKATVVATDNWDADPTVTLVSVTSNEPDNGEDDGDTVNDIVIVGDTTFELRAERSGEGRSEEHTSELQSRENLVCRLLLAKKKR